MTRSLFGPDFELPLRPDELVSAPELARRLGITESGLRYKIRRGNITAPHRIRGRFYWPEWLAAYYVRARERRLS